MLSQSPANCRACACTHRSALSTESSVDIRFSRSRSRSARSFQSPSFPLRRLPISPDHLLRYIFLFPSVVSVDALPHTEYNLPAFYCSSQLNIKPTAAPFQGTAAVFSLLSGLSFETAPNFFDSLCRCVCPQCVITAASNKVSAGR